MFPLYDVSQVWMYIVFNFSGFFSYCLLVNVNIIFMSYFIVNGICCPDIALTLCNNQIWIMIIWFHINNQKLLQQLCLLGFSLWPICNVFLCHTYMILCKKVDTQHGFDFSVQQIINCGDMCTMHIGQFFFHSYSHVWKVNLICISTN